MNIELAQIFKHKAINTWGLLLVFAVPMCIFNYLAMTGLTQIFLLRKGYRT